MSLNAQTMLPQMKSFIQFDCCLQVFSTILTVNNNIDYIFFLPEKRELKDPFPALSSVRRYYFQAACSPTTITNKVGQPVCSLRDQTQGKI